MDSGRNKLTFDNIDSYVQRVHDRAVTYSVYGDKKAIILMTKKMNVENSMNYFDMNVMQGREINKQSIAD